MTVSLDIKKEFIETVLENNEISSLDGRMFLKFLLDHDDALEYVKFVSSTFYENHLKHCDFVRAIRFFESTAVPMVSEHIINGEESVNNTLEFQFLVAVKPHEETYISIKFLPNKPRKLLYHMVQENYLDNITCETWSDIEDLRQGKDFTFIYTRPEYVPKKEREKVDYTETIESFLENSIYEQKVAKLKKEIDEALDINDIDSFMKLTKELNDLEVPTKKFEIV